MIRLARGKIRQAIPDFQHQSPFPFLYPGLIGKDGGVSSDRSSFASTSYSTLKPSKRVNAEEAIPYRSELSDGIEADAYFRRRNQALPSDKGQTSSVEIRYDSAPSVGTSQAERSTSSIDHVQGGDGGDRKGKRPERQISVAERQNILLGRTFVRDLMQRPLDSAFSVNELELLEEVSESYFQYAKKEIDLLDEIMPELALAFMHVGQDQRALSLLKRINRLCIDSDTSTSTPLQAWKQVLATAFTREKYELTANFVKAASGGLNEDDDWAMVARLEALLFKNRIQQNQHVEGEKKIVVDQFWREFELHDRKAPEVVFTILLNEQIRVGKIDAVRQTMIARQRHGHAITEEIWRSLLKLHPRGRRRGILNELLLELGIDGQQVFAGVIASLTSRKNIREVLLAFRMFGVCKDMLSKTDSWLPSLDTVETVIAYLASHSTPEAAMKMLQLALDLDIRGDYTTICLIISRNLRKEGRPVDALVFVSYVAGICLQNRLQTHSLNFPLPHPIARPSKRLFRECLYSCSLLDDPMDVVEKSREVLLDLFTHRDDSLRIRPGIVAVFRATMMNATVKEVSLFMDELSRYAMERAQKTETQDQNLSFFLDAVNSEGIVDEVYVAKREQLPKSSRDARENLEWVTRSSETFDILGGYSNATFHSTDKGDSLSAKKRAALLFDAEELNADPSVHLTPRLTSMAYALRLRVYAVIRQDYGSAIVIYRYMLAHGIKPTVHHIAPILEGLVISDRLEDVHAIRDGARQTLSDVDSSLRISTAVIRGHLRRNDWIGVRQELVGMRERRVHPDAFILSMVRKAQLLYKQLIARGYERLNEANEKVHNDLKTLVKESQREMNQDVSNEYQIKANQREEEKQTGKMIIPSLDTMKQKHLSVQKATTFYQGLYQDKRHLLAVQYLSNALRAGVRPDVKLRIAIRRHGNLLEERCTERGLNIEDLISHKGPSNRFPCDPIEPENDTREASLRASGDTHTRRRLANFYGPIVQLWQENRDFASGSHPARVERQRRSEQARNALLQLLLDLYGSDRLKEEAEQRKLHKEEIQTNDKTPASPLPLSSTS